MGRICMLVDDAAVAASLYVYHRARADLNLPLEAPPH